MSGTRARLATSPGEGPFICREGSNMKSPSAWDSWKDNPPLRHSLFGCIGSAALCLVGCLLPWGKAEVFGVTLVSVSGLDLEQGKQVAVITVLSLVALIWLLGSYGRQPGKAIPTVSGLCLLAGLLIALISGTFLADIWENASPGFVGNGLWLTLLGSVGMIVAASFALARRGGQ